MRKLTPLVGSLRPQLRFYPIDSNSNSVDESERRAIYRNAVRRVFNSATSPKTEAILIDVIDLPTSVNALLQQQMLGADYNYVFVDLDTHRYARELDDISHVGVNATVLKLNVDSWAEEAGQLYLDESLPLDRISSQAALVYDATLLLAKGVAGLGADPASPGAIGGGRYVGP